jgi:MFS family permease
VHGWGVRWWQVGLTCLGSWLIGVWYKRRRDEASGVGRCMRLFTTLAVRAIDPTLTVASRAHTRTFAHTRLTECKGTIQLACALVCIGAVGQCIAQTFEEFNAARVIAGLGIGFSSALTPVYIAEVSEASNRGMMVRRLQDILLLLVVRATPSSCTWLL